VYFLELKEAVFEEMNDSQSLNMAFSRKLVMMFA
jgi:hypothetical protein